MSSCFLHSNSLLFRPRFFIPKARQVCTQRKAITHANMTDRKMLHAVCRVGDLDKTRKFLEALGMKALRERDVPDEKYSNAFYGYGPEQHGEHFSLELTYNYGVSTYDLGDGFEHFGIAVPNVSDVVKRVQDGGFKVNREPSKTTDGKFTVADVESPTGYKFQLVEREVRDPLSHVALRVKNLDDTIKFYEAMGMKVLRKEEKESERSTMVKMGFGPEEDSTSLELNYNWDKDDYKLGDGYGQIAVSCPDVYKAAEQFKENGIEVTRDPGPVSGIGTKICGVNDPTGWKTVMVDADDFEKEFE